MTTSENQSGCPKSEINIVFNPLPELSWKAEDYDDSAKKLVQYAYCEASLAINWYLEKKAWKKRWARFLRASAILCIAVAGGIPIMTQMHPGLVSPGWATVFLLLAGTAIGLDRFFGFSSAWMRFLKTEMQVRNVLHEFLFDAETLRIRQHHGGNGTRIAEEQVQRCRDFVRSLNLILANEMEEWVKEFRENLVEIDMAAKARAETMRYGAVNLNVANGDRCDQGWELCIDAGAPTMQSGRTAALGVLLPGSHVIGITAEIDGKSVEAQAAFDVASGRTTDVTVTLE